jgi:hypothetical protein
VRAKPMGFGGWMIGKTNALNARGHFFPERRV